MAASTRRKFWMRSICVVLSVGFAAVTAELGLEWTTPTPSSTMPPRAVRLKERQRGSRVTRTPSGEMLAETLGLGKGAVTLEIDRDGFVSPSRVHDTPDLTIVFLGGSTTECEFVPAEQRFPFVAGTKLEETISKRVNALNAGVSGNHSMHSNVAIIGKVAPQDPDVVIMMHAINDLTTLLNAGTYWNDNAHRSLVIEQHINPEATRTQMQPLAGAKSFLHSCFPQLYNVAYRTKLSLMGSTDEWAKERRSTRKSDDAELARQFKQSLTLYCASVEALGAQPVLMTQGNRITGDPHPKLLGSWQKRADTSGVTYPQWRKLYETFNEVTREVAKEQQVPLIDLDRELQQHHDYFYDFVHLTPPGSEATGVIVAERIAQILTEESE